ncbi:unnamed protein product, partial [marine sediment metagenome]
MASPKRMKTRQGIRLWTVKQAPFLQGGDSNVPTWDFDLADITFTPGMAKRTAPGPFHSAPIVQGKFDGSGDGDNLSVSRGDQISGDFYSSLDYYQGSIVLWWTPEKNRDAGQSNDEFLFEFDGSFRARYEHDNARIYFSAGYQSVTASLTAVAGQTYCLVFRWDSKNTLDGTNYLCISIDDAHTFDNATPPTVTTPDSAFHIGANSGAENSSAIIEGFTVLRRVLY